MTFDAPARVVQRRRGQSRRAQARRLHAPTTTACCAVDREIREICIEDGAALRGARLHRRGGVARYRPGRRSFLILRSQQFVVDRELQIQQHRDKIKPDIIWNTERGLKQTPSGLAWAERERAAFYRRMVEFFQTYDLLVTPGAPTGGLRRQPARIPTTIDGKKLDNYMGGSTVNSVITVTGLPRHRRALRLRPVRPAGRPAARRQAARRGGVAAGRVALRKLVGLHKLLPIDPKPGTVPPS